MLTRGQKDCGLVIRMSLAAAWQGSDEFGLLLTAILILVFTSELEIIALFQSVVVRIKLDNEHKSFWKCAWQVISV